MTELRKLSGDCELEGLQELLLREMLILGLNDKKLQDYLLRESNLNLKKTVEICRIVEVTPSQAVTAINPDYNIDKIHRQFSNNQRSQKKVLK